MKRTIASPFSSRLWPTGVYLCSISTMYRLLVIAGENRERYRQGSCPAKKKRELIARAPNQVWSWDITKRILGRNERGGAHPHATVAATRAQAGWARLRRQAAWRPA